MKILVAPDSFKGSVTSIEFCEIAERAIKDIDKSIEVIKIPMADGGEGTVEAIEIATEGRIIYKTVQGPLGEDVNAAFAITGDKTTAVIELAKASGLPLVPVNKRNPMLASTYGTGQLIKEALDLGCRTIMIGLGGSATNDGAVGLLTALGIKFLTSDGRNISSGAQGLLELARIDTGKMDPRIEDTRFIGICDVENPLFGKTGASYVYGPQKGSTPEVVKLMDEGLRNYSEKIKEALGMDIADVKGSGAAGGAGGGLMAFLKAELRSGADVVKDVTGLNKLLHEQHIDLVITGEGEINHQTAYGKLPAKVAEEAQKYNIPVVAVVGKIGDGAYKMHEKGICGIFSIMNKPMSLEEALQNSKLLLYETIFEITSFYNKLVYHI